MRGVGTRRATEGRGDSTRGWCRATGSRGVPPLRVTLVGGAARAQRQLLPCTTSCDSSDCVTTCGGR
jgi:hypothetical protein